MTKITRLPRCGALMGRLFLSFSSMALPMMVDNAVDFPLAGGDLASDGDDGWNGSKQG